MESVEMTGCWKCKVCDLTFYSEEEYDEHTMSLMHHIKLELMNKGMEHECIICKVVSKNSIEYGRHLHSVEHKQLANKKKDILKPKLPEQSTYLKPSQKRGQHSSNYSHSKIETNTSFRWTNISVNAKRNLKYTPTFSKPWQWRPKNTCQSPVGYRDYSTYADHKYRNFYKYKTRSSVYKHNFLVDEQGYNYHNYNNFSAYQRCQNDIEVCDFSFDNQRPLFDNDGFSQYSSFESPVVKHNHSLQDEGTGENKRWSNTHGFALQNSEDYVESNLRVDEFPKHYDTHGFALQNSEDYVESNLHVDEFPKNYNTHGFPLQNSKDYVESNLRVDEFPKHYDAHGFPLQNSEDYVESNLRVDEFPKHYDAHGFALQNSKDDVENNLRVDKFPKHYSNISSRYKNNSHSSISNSSVNREMAKEKNRNSEGKNLSHYSCLKSKDHTDNSKEYSIESNSNIVGEEDSTFSNCHNKSKGCSKSKNKVNTQSPELEANKGDLPQKFSRTLTEKPIRRNKNKITTHAIVNKHCESIDKAVRLKNINFNKEKNYHSNLKDSERSEMKNSPLAKVAKSFGKKINLNHQDQKFYQELDEILKNGEEKLPKKDNIVDRKSTNPEKFRKKIRPAKGTKARQHNSLCKLTKFNSNLKKSVIDKISEENSVQGTSRISTSKQAASVTLQNKQKDSIFKLQELNSEIKNQFDGFVKFGDLTEEKYFSRKDKNVNENSTKNDKPALPSENSISHLTEQYQSSFAISNDLNGQSAKVWPSSSSVEHKGMKALNNLKLNDRTINKLIHGPMSRKQQQLLENVVKDYNRSLRNSKPPITGTDINAIDEYFDLNSLTPDSCIELNELPKELLCHIAHVLKVDPELMPIHPNSLVFESNDSVAKKRNTMDSEHISSNVSAVTKPGEENTEFINAIFNKSLSSCEEVDINQINQRISSIKTEEQSKSIIHPNSLIFESNDSVAKKRNTIDSEHISSNVSAVTKPGEENTEFINAIFNKSLSSCEEVDINQINQKISSIKTEEQSKSIISVTSNSQNPNSVNVLLNKNEINFVTSNNLSNVNVGDERDSVSNGSNDIKDIFDEMLDNGFYIPEILPNKKIRAKPSKKNGGVPANLSNINNVIEIPNTATPFNEIPFTKNDVISNTENKLQLSALDSENIASKETENVTIEVLSSNEKQHMSAMKGHYSSSLKSANVISQNDKCSFALEKSVNISTRESDTVSKNLNSNDADISKETQLILKPSVKNSSYIPEINTYSSEKVLPLNKMDKFHCHIPEPNLIKPTGSKMAQVLLVDKSFPLNSNQISLPQPEDNNSSFDEHDENSRIKQKNNVSSFQNSTIDNSSQHKLFRNEKLNPVLAQEISTNVDLLFPKGNSNIPPPTKVYTIEDKKEFQISSDKNLTPLFKAKSVDLKLLRKPIVLLEDIIKSQNANCCSSSVEIPRVIDTDVINQTNSELQRISQEVQEVNSCQDSFHYKAKEIEIPCVVDTDVMNQTNSELQITSRQEMNNVQDSFHYKGNEIDTNMINQTNSELQKVDNFRASVCYKGEEIETPCVIDTDMTNKTNSELQRISPQEVNNCQDSFCCKVKKEVEIPCVNTDVINQTNSELQKVDNFRASVCYKGKEIESPCVIDTDVTSQTNSELQKVDNFRASVCYKGKEKIESPCVIDTDVTSQTNSELQKVDNFRASVCYKGKEIESPCVIDTDMTNKTNSELQRISQQEVNNCQDSFHCKVKEEVEIPCVVDTDVINQTNSGWQRTSRQEVNNFQDSFHYKGNEVDTDMINQTNSELQKVGSLSYKGKEIETPCGIDTDVTNQTNSELQRTSPQQELNNLQDSFHYKGKEVEIPCVDTDVISQTNSELEMTSQHEQCIVGSTDLQNHHNLCDSQLRSFSSKKNSNLHASEKHSQEIATALNSEESRSSPCSNAANSNLCLPFVQTLIELDFKENKVNISLQNIRNELVSLNDKMSQLRSQEVQLLQEIRTIQSSRCQNLFYMGRTIGNTKESEFHTEFSPRAQNHGLSRNEAFASNVTHPIDQPPITFNVQTSSSNDKIVHVQAEAAIGNVDLQKKNSSNDSDHCITFQRDNRPMHDSINANETSKTMETGSSISTNVCVPQCDDNVSSKMPICSVSNENGLNSLKIPLNTIKIEPPDEEQSFTSTMPINESSWEHLTNVNASNTPVVHEQSRFDPETRKVDDGAQTIPCTKSTLNDVCDQRAINLSLTQRLPQMNLQYIGTLNSSDIANLSGNSRHIMELKQALESSTKSNLSIMNPKVSVNTKSAVQPKKGKKTGKIVSENVQIDLGKKILKKKSGKKIQKKKSGKKNHKKFKVSSRTMNKVNENPGVRKKGRKVSK